MTQEIRLRPTIGRLQPYVPGKRPAGDGGDDALERVVRLASNELPFASTSNVVEAIARAAASSHRYPDPEALELRAAIAERFGRDPEFVTLGAGGTALCHQAVVSTAGDGDVVLFAWPSFEGYPLFTALAGATATRVPLANGYHDLDAMAAAIDQRTRVIFLCNPNNPTGTLIDRDTLTAFLDRVPSDVLVVVDEAYREFVIKPGHQDASTLIDDFHNVVVLRTFSKAWGLAGLRVGYCLGSPRAIDVVMRSRLPFGVSSLAQAAALAALETESEMRQRVGEIVRERDRLKRATVEAGYPVASSHCNFLWLPLGDCAVDVSGQLEARGILTRPLAPYGLRITVGTKAENGRTARALAEIKMTLRLSGE